MIAYVVTVKQEDSELLQRVLPPQLLDEVHFVPAGNFSSAKSLARSLLVARRKPVALVMDAGSVVPEVIDERRQNTEEVVQSVAANVPVKIVVAIPALSAVLFQDSDILEKLLGYPIPSEILLIARYDPRDALDRLLQQTPQKLQVTDLLNALTAQDAAALQKAEPLAELRSFLQQARDLSLNGRAASAKA